MFLISNHQNVQTRVNHLKKNFNQKKESKTKNIIPVYSKVLCLSVRLLIFQNSIKRTDIVTKRESFSFFFLFV